MQTINPDRWNRINSEYPALVTQYIAEHPDTGDPIAVPTSGCPSSYNLDAFTRRVGQLINRVQRVGKNLDVGRRFIAATANPGEFIGGFPTPQEYIWRKLRT